MQNEKKPVTVKEQQFLLAIIDLIEKDYNLIMSEIKKNLSPLLFMNINMFNQDLFNEFIKQEIDTFLIYLKTNDTTKIFLRGEKAAAEGIKEDILFSIFKIIRELFLRNLSNDYNLLCFSIRILDFYIETYLISFHNTEKKLIYENQGQLYNALSETTMQQREEMLEKEKEQNRQKTAFLINLAHETKLPLTIIENQINMVKEEAGKRQLQTVLPLEEQIKGLQEMIGNILDYEKILQGKLLYNHDIIVNLSRVITSKVELFKVITEKNNLGMEAGIEEGLYVRIAPLALDRILNNILENAIKYNRMKGNIFIKAKADDTSVFFCIRDTGIGIPSDQIPHIFKPYYQCVHKKRSNQGIGAGLAIVKSILNEVGGDIAIDSIIDQGTTVRVAFEKAVITKDDKVIDDIKVSKPVTRMHVTLKDETFEECRKTILFVEDSTELLSYLQQSMMNSFNFFYAINGKDALRKLEIMPKPDVIISDIMMDIMDGYEFLTRLREKKEFEDIPFIFLTAKTTEEDKVRGLQYGAVDYIEKPFSIQVLKVKIKSLIRDHAVLSEKEIERMEKRLIKTIRTKDNDKVSYDVLYKKYNLSSREKDIVPYIINGLDNKDIANRLCISNETVKTYITRIKKKCNVKNRVQLINLFYK